MPSAERAPLRIFAKLGALVLAFASILAVVTLVELGSAALLARDGPETAPRERTPLYAVRGDADLGYALEANSSHRAVKESADGTPCYDVTYHSDALGRRTLFQRPDARNPHLILFGGSVTFGEGLSDEDTLAFHLMQELPSYDIYNYALHGYGPSHMLARLESKDFPREIASSRGAAIYVLIPTHVSRVTGDTRAFWLYSSPYYYLNARDELIRDGSFETGRAFTTRVYVGFGALKSRSSFLRLINLEIPPSIRRSDLHLTARVLIESQRRYAELFEGRFFVAFHPTWNLEDARIAEQHRVLAEVLGDAGVAILDYAGRGLQPDDTIGQGCDPHPSGRLNQRLAQDLARDLTLSLSARRR